MKTKRNFDFTWTPDLDNEVSLDRKLNLAPELDSEVSLAQELNLFLDLPTLCQQAESGTLSPSEGEERDGLEPEEALALAIAEQAIEDWRKAAQTLAARPDHQAAATLLRETERFFLSEWFHRLLDMDGAELVNILRTQQGLNNTEIAPTQDYTRLRRTMMQARRRKKNRQQRSAGMKKYV